MKNLAVIVSGKIETVIRGDASAESIAQLVASGALVIPEDEIPDGIIIDGEVLEAPPLSEEEILAGGYFDQVTGLRIRATLDDQNRYGNLCILLQLALMDRKISADTPKSITDFFGERREMTVGVLLALMVRYGLWCEAASKFKK